LKESVDVAEGGGERERERKGLLMAFVAKVVGFDYGQQRFLGKNMPLEPQTRFVPVQ